MIKKKHPGGRPLGSNNTTGWQHRTISFRPAVLREVDRESKRRGISRSGMVNILIHAWLEAEGKGDIWEKAEERHYAYET